jgi:hypothetical protein
MVRVLPRQLQEAAEVLLRPGAHLLVLATCRGRFRDLGPSSRIDLQQVAAHCGLEALADDGGEVGDGAVRQAGASGVVGSAAGEQSGVKAREVGGLEALERSRAEGRQQVQPEVARVAVERLRRTCVFRIGRQAVTHCSTATFCGRTNDPAPTCDRVSASQARASLYVAKRRFSCRRFSPGAATSTTTRYLPVASLRIGSADTTTSKARRIAGGRCTRSAASPQRWTVVRR